MAKKVQKVNVSIKEPQRPQNWQAEARIAAREVEMTMPSIEQIGSTEEAQQWLVEQAEQEGGE